MLAASSAHSTGFKLLHTASSAGMQHPNGLGIRYRQNHAGDRFDAATGLRSSSGAEGQTPSSAPSHGAVHAVAFSSHTAHTGTATRPKETMPG